MDSLPDVDVTPLDNCAVYYSLEISDGNRHNHKNMPVLLTGGGAAAFRPRRIGSTTMRPSRVRTSTSMHAMDGPLTRRSRN